MQRPFCHVRLLLLMLSFTALGGCGSAPSSPAALVGPASVAARDSVTATTVAAPSPPPSSHQPPASLLRVHFIDVGQGDSIFLQAPDGATALIDGGYDNGMALAYLKEQKVGKVDVMIVSHPHADHIGGLVEVLKAMPVGVVWTSGASHTTGTYEALL